MTLDLTVGHLERLERQAAECSRSAILRAAVPVTSVRS